MQKANIINKNPLKINEIIKNRGTNPLKILIDIFTMVQNPVQPTRQIIHFPDNDQCFRASECLPYTPTNGKFKSL